jgi:HEAT repeat protein
METPRKGFLHRLLNIYPGEEKNAFLFAFLGFIWAFASTSALKFADALFILHVGAQSLPQAYILIACGMFSIAVLLLYAFHHFSSYQIYLKTLLIGIGLYVIVFGLVYFEVALDSHWFWYGLKMSGFFFFTVLLTCYWTFIDQYHHLQDSKRLYSLFSSTIFLGSASTGFVMNSGLLDLHHLVFLIILLFIVTAAFVRLIQSKLSIVTHEDVEHEGQIYEEGSSFKFLLKTILSSRFTLLLMTCNLLNYLLLVITEYNYMFTFQSHFAAQDDSNLGGGTEAQLTLFLGQWLSVVSVCNLFFGLLIYSRLVRRFGINIMLVITPILLIISFTGWSFSPSLLFPLIGYFVVEGTLYVIDDNNFNLLLNAVPSKVKYKIRVAIESFFEPVGMLLSALLLTFFQDYSKLLGFILACCLLIVALGLRSNYLKAIFFNLSQNAIRFQRSIKEWLNKISDKQQRIAITRLLTILKMGDTQAQLFACECLLAFEDDGLLKKILKCSTQFYPSAKVKLTELLIRSPFSKHPLVLDTLQEWIQQDPDPKLKSTVHFYLAEQGLLHPDKVFNDLNSTDIRLRGAAILSLKKSYAFLPPAITAYNQTIATQHLEQMIQSPDEDELSMALEILGIVGTAHEVDLLISFLTHPSLAVSQRAARSLAAIDTIDAIQHAPTLIALLSQINDNDVRIACLKALRGINDSSLVDGIIHATIHFRPNERRLVEEIIYHMGLRTVPSLLSITRNTKIPDPSRLLAGRILGRLALPQLHANLSDIIQVEIERAYFYFYHHGTIQSQNPEIDLSILEDVLITGYQSVIDFIIQLLGIAGEVEDVEILSQALRSTNPKVRSQVVETLEKTCEPAIFRLLQPLVDDIPYAEKLRAYVKLGNQALSLTELLDRMSQSSAQVDQILSATMKYHLDLPNWRETLRQQMSRQDEIFHHFAYELLET